jgi:hypothetical protein
VEMLQPIAIVDIRGGGPLRHAMDHRAAARALRDDCLMFFPPAVAACIPLFDRLARHWLTRSRSPYVGEVAAIARILGFPGVWFLNGSYQWGCTTMARDEDGAPWLARTLDWPFPGLGRHVTVARCSGPAGEFMSVTWPGYVGTLTAMAPGRFGACINQAPLFRRTRTAWLRPYDIAANAIHAFGMRHIPPDQLLRQAFETCPTFDAARTLLERTPVARPVIYTLVGCRPGERCVIERTEETFTTHTGETVVANDWQHSVEPWEGRVGSDLMLRCSYQEACDNSRNRRDTLARFGGSLAQGSFAWVVAPVLNRYTRVAVEMCPAQAHLRVAGFDSDHSESLPKRVTEICDVSLARTAA